MKRNLQRGVALVITLIMLSVITVVAVAFLAISRRERATVTQKANATDAELSTHAGLERAKAQLIATLGASSNMLAGDLMVSRNFINPGGFDATQPDNTVNLDNVSYVYPNGQPIKATDLPKMVANLRIDPRPPVFVNTNRLGAKGPLDFRFYHDLNRNHRFDSNGAFFPVDANGRPIGTNVAWFVGDPEWIGILARPDQPHSASNRFIGRYAYLVAPAGRTLDLNYIHNQATQQGNFGGGLGFYRNQGFGTYEVNLGAFLRDLNTNAWFGYQFGPWNGPTARGAAFEEAQQILWYRFPDRVGNNYPLRINLNNVLGPSAVLSFNYAGIDACAHAAANVTVNRPDGLYRWFGADSARHFYTMHDLFIVPGAGVNVFDRDVQNVGTNTSSYDAYTLYRMLSQLGTESPEEPDIAEPAKLIQQLSAQGTNQFVTQAYGKLNLNFNNIDYRPTDFQEWDPARFFNNLANVLLHSKFYFGVTNIPVYPTNEYSQAVHRMLQLAANIYDASTNKMILLSGTPLPSVFVPQFRMTPTNVVITGYVQNNDVRNAGTWLKNNPYGIPLVIGAKKGLPNFNEYTMQTAVQGVRKLELRRRDTNSPPTMTNEMFMLSVSNLFGLECWNSYTNNFQDTMTVQVMNDVTLTITNQDRLKFTRAYSYAVATNIPAGTWRGFRLDQGGFQIPFAAVPITLSNSAYRVLPPRFDPIGTNLFERNVGFHVPGWMLTISNRLTCILSVNNQIVDFVHLPHLDTTVDISGTLMGDSGDPSEPGVVAGCWRTNRLRNSPNVFTPTEGVVNQMLISLGSQQVSPGDWTAYNSTFNDMLSSIASFKSFLRIDLTVPNTNLIQQAPFTPTRKFVINATWQANDPLVHYMMDDLRDITNNIITTFLKPIVKGFGSNNLAQINERYRPWGGNPIKSTAADPYALYVGIKDPGVVHSDDWDFPVNKFGNIGWLGRVHRGTPWQTIYLKSEQAPPEAWQTQSLDVRTHPTNDWRLMDIFTVAPHPNAARGRLSINQSGLAAWSAALSGVVYRTNLPPNIDGFRSQNLYTNDLIQPTSPQLLTMVSAINAQRSARSGQVFRSLGELMSVPELTVASPFLDFSWANQKYGMSEADYEWIPRQILSLLKVGEARFVIYSFGQSLKPADRSIVTSGPYFGTCTNYQITGEMFTRSVVRMEGAVTRPRPVIEAFNILSTD